jgi:simple sugar transport system ATP-binding protein
MSGGNLQRLLLAREITSNPKLLIAVYPVRGLDIKATEAVHNLLLEQRERGMAILLISEDLEEIFKLSDRIGVLCGGRITGIIPSEMTDIEEIGLLMMGGTGEMVL